MTGIEAKILARRLELHLRKNNFVVCQNILEGAENKYDLRGTGEITTIAELRISLRTVTLLEKKGYLYLKQFDEVDILGLYKEINHLGEEDCRLLGGAVERARRHNTAIRQELELESLEQ